MKNRQIKFRAFDRKTKKIREVFTIHIADGNPEWVQIYEPETKEKYRDIYDFDLIEFTGLKDKNGKEIYEGDIVRIENLNWEVAYVHNGFGIYPANDFSSLEQGGDEPHEIWESGMPNDKFIDVEIVGNIIENPELLK